MSIIVNQECFWMVLVENQSRTPKVRHVTLKSAQEEAARLSSNVKHRCYVLKVVGEITVRPPVPEYDYKEID